MFDQRNYLDQIFDVLNAASYTAIAVAAIMLVAAALLIATTIRLSAFSRRRELGIMRLVAHPIAFIPSRRSCSRASSPDSSGRCSPVARSSRSCISSCRLLAENLSFTFVGVNDALLVVPLLVAGVLLAAVSAGIAITRYLRV